jgi:hypothetical protein
VVRWTAVFEVPQLTRYIVKAAAALLVVAAHHAVLPRHEDAPANEPAAGHGLRAVETAVAPQETGTRLVLGPPDFLRTQETCGACEASPSSSSARGAARRAAFGSARSAVF